MSEAQDMISLEKSMSHEVKEKYMSENIYEFFKIRTKYDFNNLNFQLFN